MTETLEQAAFRLLRAAEARGKVQGLREAADDVETSIVDSGLCEDDPGAWLRERADKIEQETTP